MKVPELDNTQFQSLSRCESLGMAIKVAKEIECIYEQGWNGGQVLGFKTGMQQAYDTINSKLAEVGFNVEFTFTIEDN